MRNVISVFKLYPLLLVLTISAQLRAQSGVIRITVEGVGNDKGQVGLLLFGNPDGFPGDFSKAIRQKLIPAGEKRFEVSFDNLPYGTYAVSVMHDENMNMKLDTNLLGIPREGHGVSNNISHAMRGPRFHEASFELNSSAWSGKITLIY